LLLVERKDVETSERESEIPVRRREERERE